MPSSYRSIPDFVLRDLAGPGFGVPILMFHWLAPDDFEAKLVWLKGAGYRTLTADQVIAVAAGDLHLTQRAVALTFDDGVYNNWAVVAPLLRKHDLRGIAFVVPRLVGDGERRPSLDQVGDVDDHDDPNSVTDDDAAGRYLRWSEVEALSAEGVLEIQSHTLDHARVFTSPKIIDFQHPRPDGKPRYPWLWSSVDAEPSDELWGMPVYSTAPRMLGRRYHDDPNLRDACRKFVDVRGGRGYFADETWRFELTRFARLHESSKRPGRVESETEADQARLASLRDARQVLSERLDKPIDHVALPWSLGKSHAPRLIEEAGYRAGFTRERPSGRVYSGDDPFDIARVEGYWLESLPGPERVSLKDRFAGVRAVAVVGCGRVPSAPSGGSSIEAQRGLRNRNEPIANAPRPVP